MNLFIEWSRINGLDISDKDKSIELCNKSIEMYEGQIKGYEIMLRREELSEHNNDVKKANKERWKESLRNTRYNLTKAKNLKNKLLEKI